MNIFELHYTRKFKADKQIRTFFEKQRTSVFSTDQLKAFIASHGQTWGLGITTPGEKHIERLVKNGVLQILELTFPNEKNYTRYIYQEATPFQIALSLNKKAYLSHYIAVFLNGLTNQIPKTIYTTIEQSPKLLQKERHLEQSAIDHAFSQPQRRSENMAVYGDYRIILLNGMHTNRAGVDLTGDILYTGLERTLLDITVRPNYAGGAFAVLDAYRKALDQGLSITKLVAMLGNIDYLYPYHQCIGFLLEKAGYTGNHLSLLRRKPLDFNFYLDYDMKDPAYSNDWRLFYPRGM